MLRCTTFCILSGKKRKMNLKKLIYTTTFCLAAFSVQAQKKSKYQFTSINTIGILAGANQQVFTMQSFNGVSKNLWVHGLGFAFDNYGSNSSPIFLGTKRFLSASKKTFVYADAGVNIPWRTSNFPKPTATNNNGFELKIKPYAEVGFGITAPINNQTKFIAQLGYSHKEFGFTEKNSWIWIGPAPIMQQDVDYNFVYRRIALRLGVVF